MLAGGGGWWGEGQVAAAAQRTGPPNGGIWAHKTVKNGFALKCSLPLWEGTHGMFGRFWPNFELPGPSKPPALALRGPVGAIRGRNGHLWTPKSRKMVWPENDI